MPDATARAPAAACERLGTEGRGGGTAAELEQASKGTGRLLDLPTLEEFTEQASRRPPSATLSDEERPRRLVIAYATMNFKATMAEVQLRASCAADIARFCALPDKHLNCLVQRTKDVGACCAASIRNTLGDPVLTEPLDHHGMTIPAGSMRYYEDEKCGSSTATLAYPTVHDGVSDGPGDVHFDIEGEIDRGFVTPDQKIGDLRVAGGEKFIPGKEGEARSVRLSRDSTVDGVTWAAIGRPLKLHANGRVAEGWLVTATRIGDATWMIMNGFAVMKDSTLLIDSVGRLVRAGLSGAVFYRGVLYPGGSVLTFDEHRNVVTDSLREQWTRWRTNGINLHRIGVAIDAPREVADVELPVGSLIFESEDGNVTQAIASQEVHYAETTIGPGRLYFEQDHPVGWTLSQAEIVAPQRYGSMAIGAPHRSLARFSRGRLSNVMLAENVDQHGHVFTAGKWVRLDEAGSIISGTIVQDATYGGLTLPKGTHVSLGTESTLRKVEASGPVASSTAIFDGDAMEFHPDGTIADAVLHRNATLDGVTYAAGTQLAFAPSGEVLASRMHERRWSEGFPPTPRDLETRATIVVGPARTRLMTPSKEFCDRKTQWIETGEGPALSSSYLMLDPRMCTGHEDDGVIGRDR